MTWPELASDALVAARNGRTVLVRTSSGEVQEVNESAAFVLSHRTLFHDLDDAASELAAAVDIDRELVRNDLLTLDQQLSDTRPKGAQRTRYLDAARRDQAEQDTPTGASRRFCVAALDSCVTVVSHDDALTSALEPLLAAHPTCAGAGERIDTWRGAAGIVVTLNGRRMSLESSTTLAAETVVSLLTAIAVDDSTSQPLLHAAAVELSGNAVILAGPSGAGKSSTTVELVRAGAGYMSDEVVRVDLDRRLVAGLPRAIGFEGPARRHHQDLRPRSQDGFAVDRRWSLGPLDLGRVTLEAPIEALVFMEQSRAEPTWTRHLQWPDALTRLMPVLYHRESLTQGQLDDLVALLDAVPCYHVRHQGSRDAADQVRALHSGLERGRTP